MPDVRLAGCGSRPLAGYLKALGVLRVVARQVDPEARGRWRDATFELRSKLELEALIEFLTSTYRPAPAISPWNGGSGFYRKGNTTAFAARERIESSDDRRLADVRVAISSAWATMTRLKIDQKPDGELKARLIRDLRASLPDLALEWLDAATVLVDGRVQPLPVLGTGGNDGRYDFSSNFLQALDLVLCGSLGVDAVERLLRAALSGQGAPLRSLALGHFMRDASPTGAPTGEPDSLGNPWDLVLAIEGSVLLAASATRRHAAQSSRQLVSPFTVHLSETGFSSSSTGESGRGELWLPLWPGWASLREIEVLVRESRAQVGRRFVRSGLDFARAAGSLGVARGLSHFERYAIVERAGQSSLAVPVGRIAVRDHPAAAAIRMLDPWLDYILRFGRSRECPRAARTALKVLEGEVFALAGRGDSQSAERVIVALGEVEQALARSARRAEDAGLRPLRGIAAAPWLAAADDGSPEFLVATCLASLRDRSQRELPTLRDQWHGTRHDGRSFDADLTARVGGSDTVSRLAAIHARREIEPGRVSTGFGLGTWCGLSAPRLFVAGSLDDERIGRLLGGLVLLDHHGAVLPRRARLATQPNPAYELLALASAEAADHFVGGRNGWATILSRGVVAPVLRDALLRLRMAEMTPRVAEVDLLVAPPTGPRLGAALLLHLSPAALRRIADSLTHPRQASSEPIPALEEATP